MGLEDPSDAAKTPTPGFVLLLARLADAMERESVAGVLELVAAGFAGQGVGAGGDQPPAFVAGDVARSETPVICICHGWQGDGVKPLAKRLQDISRKWNYWAQ